MNSSCLPIPTGEDRPSLEEVCLLTGTDEIPVWFAHALERMVEETGVTVSVVVISRPPTGDARAGLFGAARALAEAVEHGFVLRVGKLILGSSQEWISIDTVSCLSRAEVRECRLQSVDGTRVRVPEEVTEFISGEADVVVQFGTGILDGEILDAPSYGVVGYHHGDIYRHRGSPPGFWEFMAGDSTVGVTLQILTEELDAGYVVCLERFDATDLASWAAIRQRMYGVSETMLSDAILRLREKPGTIERASPDELGDLHNRADVTIPIKIRYVVKELSPL